MTTHMLHLTPHSTTRKHRVAIMVDDRLEHAAIVQFTGLGPDAPDDIVVDLPGKPAEALDILIDRITALRDKLANP